jgi:hypothetical protein
MTKQIFTALALVALGLTGVTLALAAAFTNVLLPTQLDAYIHESLLAQFFYTGFFSGIVLLCLGACKWDEVREFQAQEKRLKRFKDRLPS